MEGEEVQSEVVKIYHPFSMAVCGPTNSGKTFWVYKFLELYNEVVVVDKIVKVMYCYSVEQELYNKVLSEIKDVMFYKGIPELDDMYKYFDGKPGLLVSDDLMYEVLNNQSMLKLFTQGIHHHNVSVIFMSQNIFQQGIHARTIALNVKYLVLFYNPRDKAQIKYLGRQIYPSNGEILLETYMDAVKERKWGYLLLDLSSNCPENLRMRSNVLPNESDVIVVYIPKVLQ